MGTEFAPENKQSKRNVMTPEKSNVDVMVADFLVFTGFRTFFQPDYDRSQYFIIGLANFYPTIAEIRTQKYLTELFYHWEYDSIKRIGCDVMMAVYVMIFVFVYLI